ncbi:MAG: efflux RND transporter periplasmic adaptor subunit [Planctomycetaceae bacterium]|nr:efflux RND transporter periplasmic adaptor subunit [Planctomycetaceae bacterium]
MLLLAGCNEPVVADHNPPAASAASGGALEVVLAGPPVRKSLKLISVQPARVEPIEQTPIQSKIAAYVAEVVVDFGDTVKKDQPLIKLRAPELDAELAQKQALLEQAKAELVQAESGATAAQAAIVTAKSQVVRSAAAIERSQADVRLRESEHQRIEELANSGSVNRQLLDEARQKLAAAEASRSESRAAKDSAQAVVTQVEADAAKAMADVAAARARVRVAEANVTQLEAMRSYLTLAAPFDGVVTLRRVDPGHLVQPASASAEPLLVVARTDRMRITAPVPELEAAAVDIGDEATIEVQSLKGAEFTGKVSRTSLALDEGSRALDAIIDLENSDSRLRPGMYATVRLTLDERKDALTLPTAAIVRQGKEAFCYCLADGKAVKTPVQLGIRVGDDFEIASGLSDDVLAILNKATSLKDGQPVEATKPPPP